MNKKFFIISIIVMMIFIPIKIYADTCSVEVQNEYYNKINNIKYSINRIEDNDYSITFYNIPENVSISNMYGVKINDYGTTEATSSIYDGGKNYTFYYTISKLDCRMSINFQKNIYVTKYNVYSEREECKQEGNEDFKFCNPGYQGIITDETFTKELNKYIEKQNQVIEEEPIEIEKPSYTLYYIIGSISLLVILIVIISISVRSKKKRSKLL